MAESLKRKMLNKLFSTVQGNTFYRPDIDGLRAIAVLLVVLFHAFPNKLTGGFVGVDIFFVISGYLISSIILKEIAGNKFTILGFYKKRINRIYPALIFVLAISIVISKAVLFKAEMADFNLSVFFSTIFLANIFFLNTLNYFDNSAENHPLLHLWSLGVEEQFYIFWPLLLILIARKKTLFSINIVFGLLLVSFVLNVFFISKYQSNVFYLPFTRLWELGFGSLCAFVTRAGFQNHVKQRFKFISDADLIVGIGLLLILLGELIVKPSSLFPGWYALLPVLGSGLLLVYGDKSKFASLLLANKLFVFIGLISYPLYLWHWPILSFGHIHFGYLMVGSTKVVLVALSFVLATITYFLVEQPLRFKINHRFKSAILFGSLIIIGLYSLINYQAIVTSKQTVIDQFVSFNKDYVAINDYVAKNRLHCGFIDQKGAFSENLPSDCLVLNEKKAVLIWGDSHGYQLFYGLNRHLDETYQLNQLTSSGCHPYIGANQPNASPNCLLANKRSLQLIESSKPNTVIIAQKDEHDLTDWTLVSKELMARGVKHVVLLGPVPQWNQYLYRYLAKSFTNLENMPNSLSGSIQNKQIIALDKSLKAKYGHADSLQYISMIDLLCAQNRECLTFVEDEQNHKELVTFDYGHLGLKASDKVGKSISSLIKHDE
jgi:peptidoglycan/LPS O-acetylase OafA/YrhL